MTLTPAIFAAVAFTVAVTRIQAQTLNWGNDLTGGLSDSTGAALDDTFVFELGSFFNGFVPTASNHEEWILNWEVFDQASYNEDIQHFTSTVYVLNGVTSSDRPPGSTLSFAGLDAYIWIRNDDNPVPGTEWLLTRADNWTFPVVGGDCCNTQVIEWAVSDLDSGNVPEWGRQNTVIGTGEFSSTSNTGLQTFTFVPEPSSALLAAVTGGFLVLRRRRSDP